MSAKETEQAMPDWSAYRGVLIFVEQRGGEAKSVSWQLLGEGKKLAQKLDVPLMAVVMGENVEHLAQEADLLRRGQSVSCATRRS